MTKRHTFLFFTSARIQSTLVGFALILGLAGFFTFKNAFGFVVQGDSDKAEITLVHITIATTNTAAMAAFYNKVFNCELKGFDMQGHTLYNGSLAGMGLLLCPVEVAGVDVKQNRHQLKFRVSDLRKTVATALAAGGAELNPITEQGSMLFASLRDPDGNSIELIQLVK